MAHSIPMVAKAGFAVLSMAGAATLLALPARADSASGAAVVTSPSGRTVSVSAEVVTLSGVFQDVTVTPTFFTDADGYVEYASSLQVTPTYSTAPVAGSGNDIAALLNAVYGATSPVPNADPEYQLAVVRALVSGGALD